MTPKPKTQKEKTSQKPSFSEIKDLEKEWGLVETEKEAEISAFNAFKLLLKLLIVGGAIALIFLSILLSYYKLKKKLGYDPITRNFQFF